MKNLLFFISLLFLSACTVTPSKEPRTYSVFLDKSFVKNLDFKGRELIPIRIKDNWYYVHSSGKAMLVMLNEEGNVDTFKEGLARTRINGKIGFFDKNLDIVLKPIYDYAFPFHNGVAEICIGCKELLSDGNSLLDGGAWKRIDRTGLILEE